MPGEIAVLVYHEGTPYYIPTEELAQFEVAGDELAALERDASPDAEPVDRLSAYKLEDVGPRPIPHWPIHAAP
jgi:hypothetical protein